MYYKKKQKIDAKFDSGDYYKVEEFEKSFSTTRFVNLLQFFCFVLLKNK